MSSIRDLLESMNRFAGERVGQKPGDQVRGSEPVPKKGGHKKHPYDGRLVGAAESSDNILKELDQVINENPVRRDLFKEWEEFKTVNEEIVSEWGAPGTAVGPGNDDLDPVELAAQRNQAKYAKDEVRGQVSGLTAQLQGARAQLSDMNQQFPQGANPVEKTMALQQMSAQKIGVKKQIEDLTKQIAALRSQAI
jgi:hypothetical protein